MNPQPIVILVNSLADFRIEVPVPAVVRLNLTERRTSKELGWSDHGFSLPTLLVHLDLQGVNPDGQIVWLHYGQELDRTPGGNEFWTVS